MKNPSGKKLEKLVFGMFDQMVEGSDKYITEQGSTWLIFTEDKRWVVEFTKDKTLWFNYNLFQSELDLVSKDCTEEKDLIKNWFESRFLNTNGVRHAKYLLSKHQPNVEDTIQNGVRHTIPDQTNVLCSVEDTIQNGVRHTLTGWYLSDRPVEDTIQNGVKHTEFNVQWLVQVVEDTIQNGVKHTELSKRDFFPEDILQNGVRHTVSSKLNEFEFVEDTIQNGVKDTHFNFQSGLIQVEDVIQNGVRHTEVDGMRIRRGVKDAIQEGVKETTTTRWARKDAVENTIQNGVKHTEDGDWLDQDERIDDIIQNGVKETKEVSNISLMSEMFKVKAKQAIRDGVKEIQPLPAQDGNRDWGLYYHRQEDRTKPHTEYVKEVIEDSYNHMGRVEGVIRNTDKDGI